MKCCDCGRWLWFDRGVIRTYTNMQVRSAYTSLCEDCVMNRWLHEKLISKGRI